MGIYNTISLTSHVSKPLTKIIHRSAKNKIEQNEIELDEGQFSFRKKTGTQEAILILSLITERRLTKNKDTLTAFVKVEKHLIT